MTLLTAAEHALAIRAAELALAAYDHVTIETERVHALIVEEPDAVLLGLQGTHDLEALRLDLLAAVHRDDPILGTTPDSFASDAEQIFWRVWPKLPPAKPLIFGAHSKGASEIEGLTAMFRNAGRAPLFMGAFEPAPIGTLNGFLADQPGIATWLGIDITRLDARDPIPAAKPPWVVLAHAYPITPLAWIGPRPRDLLDYHAMAAVLTAVKALPVAPALIAAAPAS